MKSKNPNAFWLRWFGASSLYGFIYSFLWRDIPDIYLTWGIPFLFIFLNSFVLSVLQYNAMPETIRPDAKRWYLSSIFAQIVAAIIHFLLLILVVNNPMLMITALYLPLAVAQSWVLGESFKKSWLFGTAFMVGALTFAIRPILYNNTYIFLYHIFTHIFFWFLMGASLIFLQKYQRKETTSLNTAYERLSIQEENEANFPDESIALAQQKMS